jgi:hypothetical protein
MEQSQNWTFESVWNDTLAKPKKKRERRTHIWAGEVGKPLLEVYWSMSGKQPSNELSPRVLRKMAAGVWFEDMVVHMLKTIGILQSSQERISVPEDDDHLEVTGKIDAVSGGVTDWNEARERVKKEEFPEFVEAVAYELIDHFEKKYPNGLTESIDEVKSVNSQVFWAKKDYLEEAYPHHVLQLYTYLKAKTKPAGRLIYISKDDLTIAERPVLYPTERLSDDWDFRVREITKHIRRRNELEEMLEAKKISPAEFQKEMDKNQPPMPDEIIFDERGKIKFQCNKVKYEIKGCWKENWMVKWSPYFSDMTGFKDDEEGLGEDKWIESLKPRLKELNDAIKEKYKVDNNIQKEKK